LARTVQLVRDPDILLKNSEAIVATADSHILDHAERWFNLVREVLSAQVSAQVDDAWLIELPAN